MGIDYQITTPEFDKRNTTAYQLSILLGMDSLVYFISSADNVALFFKSVHFTSASDNKANALVKNLGHFLEREELMGYLFRRIKVALPQALAALVPNRLFKDEELSTYVASLTDLVNGEETKADALSFTDARIVYQQDLEVSTLIRKKMPTARIYNLATPILEASHALATPTLKNYVVLNIHGRTLQLGHFSDGKLQFYNSFSFTSANDVLYYTLLVYDQFQLDPAKIPLFLAGEVMPSSHIYKLIYRFVADIQFAPLPSFITWSKKFSDLPSQQFFALFGLTLCQY